MEPTVTICIARQVMWGEGEHSGSRRECATSSGLPLVLLAGAYLVGRLMDKDDCEVRIQARLHRRELRCRTSVVVKRYCFYIPSYSSFLIEGAWESTERMSKCPRA